MSEKVRHNLTLPKDVHSALEIISEQTGEDIASIMRTYIRVGLYMTANAQKGGKLLIEDENGNQKEIVIL